MTNPLASNDAVSNRQRVVETECLDWPTHEVSDLSFRIQGDYSVVLPKFWLTGFFGKHCSGSPSLEAPPRLEFHSVRGTLIMFALVCTAPVL
jgi:hypothetical protein